MKILIANDPFLDIGVAVELLRRVAAPVDVTILTALGAPPVLSGVSADQTGVELAAHIASEAGAGMVGYASGGVVAERLSPSIQEAHLHDEHQRTELHTTVAKERLDLLMNELEAAGIAAQAKWTAHDTHTAKAILESAAEQDIGLVIIGGHGLPRINSLRRSEVDKLVHGSPIPVLVTPPSRERVGTRQTGA